MTVMARRAWNLESGRSHQRATKQVQRITKPAVQYTQISLRQTRQRRNLGFVHL